MKSLEIVNEIINKLKGKPELEYWNGNKVNCLFRNEEGAGLLTCSLLEQIKQDLEVLEILQVLILHNGKSVGYKGIIRDFEVMFRLGKITKEQLDRFKQWLEENENE